MKRPGILLTISLFCITVVAVGIVMMIGFLYTARNVVFQENATHLSDIARSVDCRVKQTMDRWQEELEHLVHAKDTLFAEHMLQNDPESLKNILQSTLPVLSGMANDILVRKNGEILLSLESDEKDYYQVESDVNGDSLLVCRGRDGTEYLGITMSSADGTLEYILLMEINLFWEQSVGSSVYDTYRILLYEEENGLLIHRENGTSYCQWVTGDELHKKGNEYRLLLAYQENGDYGYNEFQSTNEQGKETFCHMVAMSEKKSDNGIFAICIIENIDELVWKVNNIQYRAFGTVFLLVGGTAGLAFTMLYNRRRRTEMIQQLDDLALKNQLTAEYLEQQKALAHHQRLEVVGTLTAGIAHEFNNLLTPIMGYSLMLLEKISPDDEETYDSILEIYNASQKAKTIIAELSNLTRKSNTNQTQSISPDRLVEKVRMLAGSACPNNIKTVLDLKAGDATVQGDETRLSQMLLNLILNACQAMEDTGGILSVSTGVQGNQVWIKVADTGTGIPSELMEKIFDPFFTTKETGKGTGLGLAIVQKIVQDADGTLDVENRPEGGCCFTVFLNRDDKLGVHYYSKAVISEPYTIETIRDDDR